jgi:hypothetical protein
MQIQDHPDSAEWTLSMPSDVGRTALQQVTSSWVRSDPEAMKAWLTKNSQRMDGETIGHLKYALSELVKRDASSAAAWAESLPTGALRDSIQVQAATAQAKAGSIDGIRTIYAMLATRDSNGDMAKLVATTLAESRGEDAASWAESLPAGAARTAALRSVAAEWGQRDPAAAADWLRELPAGKDRDGSIADYTSKISCVEPVAAAQWVSEISDRSERENAAAQVYFTWGQENPGAAAAWVKQLTGVSDIWRRETLRPRL